MLCSIVTLHVRVWIEIPQHICTNAVLKVTLHVRVWIEIIIGFILNQVF